MKTLTKLISPIILLLLTACIADDIDTQRTYITLINDSESKLRGLQGFVGSDPTIRSQNFDNISPGNEATIPFAMDCSQDWQLHVRLDGLLFLYNYSDYTDTQVPCNETTTCIVHIDESFSCDK